MKRLALGLMLLSLFLAPQAMAQDTPLSTVDSILERVDRTADQVERARRALEEARRIGNGDIIEERRREYQRSREQYRDAQQSLDEAKVDALARESGHSRAEIRSMRNSGMGWGRIAREVGAHPSVLGKGQGSAGKGKGHPGKGAMMKHGRDYDRDDRSYEDYDDDRGSKGKGKSKARGGRGKGKQK